MQNEPKEYRTDEGSDFKMSYYDDKGNKVSTLLEASWVGPVQQLKFSGVTFPDHINKPCVKIHFDPPSVWVNPELSWDAAAKQFWNAVARSVGKPALFPEEK